MKIWSKGLGKMTLDMDIGATTPSVERDKLVLRGKIGPPVNWDFWIKMDDRDVSNIVRIAMKKPSIKFAFGYISGVFKKPFRKKEEEQKEEKNE
jgi:hypothetical protein